MTDPIDRALARRLDAFTVPPLPAGFADAVAARAMALPDMPPLPKLRQTARRRWLRTGVAGLSVVAAGMISVAAAASGYFGEPIRHAVERAPVIGAVIERVVPRPKPAAALVRAKSPAPVTAAPQPEASLAPPALLPPRLERRAERLRRTDERLASDPKAQQWLAEHPAAAARLEQGRERLHEAEARAGRRQRWRAEQGFAPVVIPVARLTPAERRAERQRRLQDFRERRLRRLEAMEGQGE